MDPTDQAEHWRQALAAQGAVVGQHERTLNGVTSQLAELTTSVSRLSAAMNEIVAYHSTRTEPHREAAAPEGPTQSSEPPGAREPFIPTPQRYNGELGACARFLLQCRLVFDLQPQTYRSDRSRLAYVISLLGGRAAQWASAEYDGAGGSDHSFASFSRLMRKIFDHPVRGREASQRLLTLGQGSGSVADYAVEFRILAAESGWGDIALQGAFLKGLAEYIKDELAARDDTTDLEELISLAIRLDNRLRERRRERGSTLRFSRSEISSPLTSQPRASPSASSSPSSTSAPPCEEPMQLGHARLTQEEHRRRLLAGLCFYCGENGHGINACPRRPKGRAQRERGESR